MENYNLHIYTVSIIYRTAAKCIDKMRDLNKLAKENDVQIEFRGPNMYVLGRHQRKYKVPQKCINDPEKLCNMIEQRILNAWK